MHLQRQDHWEFRGDESIFGDGSRHIVKHCHGAESVATGQEGVICQASRSRAQICLGLEPRERLLCHVRVSSASPVPAVDFHLSALQQQVAAVDVG